MDSSENTHILEINDENKYGLLKMYDLHIPGRMDEAVDILAEWARSQKHFVKKDFPRVYLEKTIITCKGSLERAKISIDKMCTFRTMMPRFFGDFDFVDDFEDLNQVADVIILPKKAPGHVTVIMSRVFGDHFNPSFVLQIFRRVIIVGDYLKAHDYADGFIYIIDYTNINIMNIVKILNFMDIKDGFTILMEGLGCNIRGIYNITTSTAIEMVVSVIKQTASAKVGNRIYVHKNADNLDDVVPREILPREYGGKERSYDQLFEEWKNELSSKEHKNYMRFMNARCTDETLRQTDDIDNEYMGIAGTFRNLCVD